MENQEVIKTLQETFPDDILEVSEQFGDKVLSFKKSALIPIMQFLKEKPYSYSMLLDLTCVDYPDEPQRFEMVYHVFSLSHKLKLRLKARLGMDDLVIASLTGLWKNANWLEREVFDMFGIQFTDHPDLRRLFMYDGFEGYPLRKDYPLRKQQPRIPMRKNDDD